jgi:hypothetical protein
MESQPEFIKPELTVGEATILVTHLTEFLNGSQRRRKALINKKFELIGIVLFATFGFKNSAVHGFQKLVPYFTANHWQLVREIMEIKSKIRRMEYSNQLLAKINRNIAEMTNSGNQSDYESFLLYDALKWKQLEDNYVKLGVCKSEIELRREVADLYDKCA